jgi:hypothetical protein|tara:strand:+ start:3198 stop:3932 length:735 start_codon:yes stop_codon:yes gene_type:complete
MYNNPFHKTDKENIFHLAPIPVYKRVFENCPVTENLYFLGKKILTSTEKQMGQELPDVYDKERQDGYEVNYNRQDEWTENHELQPIGSRFHVPPNDFLENHKTNPETNSGNSDVDLITKRIKMCFKELLWSQGNKLKIEPTITESWLQFYEPTKGRGHNAHNHNRWQFGEEKPKMYSGGYYLHDGEPLKDHPYSGAFSFHIRGSKHYIRPQVGMLLIWPHDIIHSVEPFYGRVPRAVINFNIQA